MKTQKIEVERLEAKEVDRRVAPVAILSPAISFGGRVDRLVNDTSDGI